MVLSLPVTTFNTCFKIALYKLRGGVSFPVKLMVLVNLITGGTVLVIRFTGGRMSTNGRLIRSIVRTSGLHFEPVIVASLTFILNVLPLILTSNPNSTTERGVKAKIFFNVVTTVALKVICMPFFFM